MLELLLLAELFFRLTRYLLPLLLSLLEFALWFVLLFLLQLLF